MSSIDGEHSPSSTSLKQKVRQSISEGGITLVVMLGKPCRDCVTTVICNIMLLSCIKYRGIIESQDLPTDYRPHFHLSVDKAGESLSQFRYNVFPGLCGLYRTGLLLTICKYPNSSTCLIDIHPIHMQTLEENVM